MAMSVVFFFFQAEDGIRDYKVTGVQTCALPISPTEQDEFVQLFAALLQRAYMSQMVSSQSGMQGGLAIQYTGESVDGDRATVAAVMGSRSGKEMPLEYRMIQDGERWAVYDVAVGGMSLVASYRAQFSKVIRQSSYADLVVRLKNTRGN